jgi:hypothetical protein
VYKILPCSSKSRSGNRWFVRAGILSGQPFTIIGVLPGDRCSLQCWLIIETPGGVHSGDGLLFLAAHLPQQAPRWPAKAGEYY